MEKQSLIITIRAGMPMPEETAASIAGHFSYRQIARNDFFLEEGAVSDEYLFLEHGMMRAFTLDPDGNEITTAFFSSGHFVFEVASLFQRTPSKENIQALEDCSGWSITYDQIQTLFHSVPEFREFGRGVLVKGFISFKQRTLSLINETAEARYEHFVRTRPEVMHSAPLKHIASFLGITDSSLSRIRRQSLRK